MSRGADRSPRLRSFGCVRAATDSGSFDHAILIFSCGASRGCNMPSKSVGGRTMQLELMWHCGAHHGRELFRDNLLARSAATFFSFAPGTAADRLTPAARQVLRRTAASCVELECILRRQALAWLAFNDLTDSSGPAITIAIRRLDHDADRLNRVMRRS